MRRRHPRAVLPYTALAALALGGSAASCNLVLGLGDYIDCPEDPKCPKGTGGATTTSANTGVTTPAPTCTDEKKNGTETDIDCGGSDCPKCADEKGCDNGGDCSSKVCTGGLCIAPSCTDTVQNGEETDKDCGGASCPKCAFDGACVVDGDCIGGTCAGGKCAASCTDGVKDGSETDVDCGGPECPKCKEMEGCATGPDCETGVCQAQKCVSYYVWAKSFGDQSTQSPSGLSVDTAGSVVIAGGTQGTVDFGGGPLTSAGANDVFVAKLDKDGTHKWSKRFGDDKEQKAFGVVTDAAQNVILLGTYDGTINFGGQTLITSTGAPLPTVHTGLFLAKLDTNGQHTWTNGFLNTSAGNNTFNLTSQSIATTNDTSGEVYIAGGFQNSVSFGGSQLTSSPGFDDIFIAAFDKSGAHLWSKSLGGAGREFATSVAYDPSDGFIVVGGWFRGGSLVFDGHSITAASTNGNVFIAKIVDGAHVWSKAFATNDHYDVSVGTGVSVAVGSTGNIYLAGHQTNATDFGGGPVAGTFYLVKLDAAGNHLWSKGFAIGGITTGGSPVSIAVDLNDSVIISNQFIGTADFGSAHLSFPDSLATATYVAKFDASGSLLWSRAFGDGTFALPTGLGAYAPGFVYLSGHYNGQIDFGGGALTSLGYDIFVAKLLVP